MIGFVQLSRLQKTLKDKYQRSQFWVLLDELFNHLNAVYTVFSIERDINVYPGLLVSHFYDWALSTFDWFDCRTDTTTNHLSGNSVDKGGFFYSRIVAKKVDIWLR